MGLRFRKSFGLFPGVRLNIGKRSASIRVGGQGFGITSGTAGSRASIGIPGSGLSYTTKLGGTGQQRPGGAPGRTAAPLIVAALIIAALAAAGLNWSF